MMFFRSRRNSRNAGASIRGSRLSVMRLEDREVPAATLAGIADTDFASTKPLFVPVVGTSSLNQPITYSVASGNANVSANVVTGGRTLKLDVSGKDNTGQAFTGSLTLRLFEEVAPLATGRIIQLANQGFYNGLIFHRVIDNFVIQGGDPNGNGTGGSTLPNFADEFNRDFTFTSNGLLAMANSGDDTNNSQFFITDIDRTLSQRPEHLNFNHTIFGILTSGFDTFQKIITTPTGSGDRPITPVVIEEAKIISDTSNAVLRIQSQNNFTGPATITVSGTDGDGAASTKSFTVTSAVSNVNDRAFLNRVADPSVVRDGSVSFTLSGVDRDGDTLTYAIGTPGNLAQAPANVTVSLDQATGAVTLTPAAGFTGTIPLLVGVRDQTRRAQTPTGVLAPLDDIGNFDTQVVTLTVRTPTAAAITLTASPLTVGAGQASLLTATVTGDEAAGGGTVTFVSNGTTLGQSNVQNGKALFSAQFTAEGSQQISATFKAATGNATATSNTTTVVVTATSPPPTTSGFTAKNVPAGSAPRVTVLNPDGSALRTFQAFEDSFTGGVRVALADVNGDGIEDLVCVPAAGGAPLIRVFNTITGATIRETMIFEDTFRGGLYVSVADSFRLGYSQILVGAGNTGGPRVTLYDARNNRVLLNYFAFDPNFRGGVTVAFGDLRNNGLNQIITGAGPGGGPIVNVYEGSSTTRAVPDFLGTFLAGQETNRDGIRVGVGEIPSGGTRRPILVGPISPDDAPFTQSFDPLGAGIDL